MSKKHPARHERSRSFAISAWPLSFKVALAIAIPLLLAVILGALQVRSDLKEASNSSASAQQVTVLRPAIDYLDAAERAMVAAQDPTDGSATELEGAIQDAQDAAAQLEQVSGTANLTADQRYQIDAMLDLSAAIREANTETLSADTWIAQLRQLQSGVTQLISSIGNAQLEPEPRLELLDQTLSGRFSLAMQEALAATERAGNTGDLELFAELGVEGAAIDRLASELGESDPAIAALRTENANRTGIIRTEKDEDLGAGAAYTQYDDLTTTLLDDIDGQLASSADDAERSALVSGGITLGALLATLLLAFLVSRLLLNPIRKVREGARKVAHEQLPDAVARIRSGEDPGPITPIDVTTHEEVGQLARAVDDLHEQAVTLASGEARLRAQVSEMFITLSRRNTSLINQQLDLIETLEKDEEDARRLESLFRLDHLASRMRRTGDSLLVLADAPTRTGTENNLTVAASLQAATAGVQDYKRVRVGSASTARISDAAAADVVHLLTELVDNALAYSPPDSTVLLSSARAPEGVAIEIEDSGLGVADAALLEINETLRGGGDVTPDTARRMGLFVVSRLARRHGITVSLHRNSHNGTTASVLLPNSLLSLAAPAVAPPPPPSAVPETPRTQAPAPVDQPEAPTLEDRLNAAIGLPRRTPGAQTPATAPTGAPSQEPADAPAAHETPPPAARTAPPDERMPTTRPAESLPTRTPGEALPSRTPGSALPIRAPGEGLPKATPAAAPPTPPDVPQTAAAYAAASHIPPSAATASDQEPSGQAAFPPLADSEAEADTPIFKALRSAWLSANATTDTWRSSEIEAGWARADHVAASLPDAPVNPSGLPVRRPGQRLVPGGVSKPAAAGTRDPDAVRARLAAHAAGVSRGRAAAATTVADSQSSEESPA